MAVRPGTREAGRESGMWLGPQIYYEEKRGVDHLGVSLLRLDDRVSAIERIRCLACRPGGAGKSPEVVTHSRGYRGQQAVAWWTPTGNVQLPSTRERERKKVRELGQDQDRTMLCAARSYLGTEKGATYTHLGHATGPDLLDPCLVTPSRRMALVVADKNREQRHSPRYCT